MYLYIKNMVCNRCILVVNNILESEGIAPELVLLGEVKLKQDPPAAVLENVRQKLEQVGFEILTDQKKKLVESIKKIIRTQIENNDRNLNYSAIIADTLKKEYSYLSKLFSESEGVTIEKYLIDQKIEKVKELLAYDEISLTGIAERLGYSSVAHLSSQFKKTTGVNPSAFRKIHDHHRKPLDQL